MEEDISDGPGDLEVEWEGWSAHDDVKGGELPPHLVHRARIQELAYFKNRCIYEYASTSKAIQSVGRRPLRLKSSVYRGPLERHRGDLFGDSAP